MINLTLDKKIFIPKFYPYITDYSHRWEFLYGGAGSGKSYSITQKIIIRCCREKIRVLVCRRYGTTIRQTVFALFKEILEKWQLTPYVKIRESDFNIKFPNGSEIIFMGLDDEGKLLSLSNISTVWIEEAFEVSKDMVEQLDLRMRGAANNQQIIMSWNPISKLHWIYDFVELNPPLNSIKIHSTFKDNPFLNKEYVAAMEELRTRNPRKAEVYYYGNYGSDAEGLVYQNWTTQEIDVAALLKNKDIQHRAGCDLGFVDPTAVVDTLYDKTNKIIYVIGEWYERGKQLDEVAAAIHTLKLDKTKLYCDSAEPRSIEYLKRQGINAVPCIKGQGSVQSRIAFIQNHTVIIDPKCENVITEISNYSYIKDKKTGKLTEETTHEFSHALDALGYAYSDIYRRGGLGTIEKSALGL